MDRRSGARDIAGLLATLILMGLSGHWLTATVSSNGLSNNSLVVLLTAVITAWLLTLFAGIPLFLDWRKRRTVQENDQALIRDEVLGHDARDGLPQKPALSVRFDTLTRTVEDAVREMKTSALNREEELSALRKWQTDHDRNHKR